MCFKKTSLLIITSILICGCTMSYKTEMLTTSPQGHTIHHNGAFSHDGQWIVFDGRNDDTKIGETATIGIVNLETGEEKIIYTTQNQTVFGPGVGAVSFSPKENKVIFIHGLPDANEEKPYAMSRRTGVGIDINFPEKPFFYDARDVSFPYTPGSLRGGTHSHCWSGDGELISFTYNDELVDPDLRVVGVMIPQEVHVDARAGNNNGTMYSAIVTDVVRNPTPGSDEINKAFDECWINGYTNSKGEYINHAVAFQGNVVNRDGKQITEVFVVDITLEKILDDKNAVGKEGERPQVPKGIKQRRITFSEKGLSDTRHWLRASADGKYIYALAKDENDRNQLVQVEINSGKMEYISQNEHSIDYSFNLSPDGKQIAYIAQNNVYLFDLKDRKARKISSETGKMVGAPVFSPKNDIIIFNQYINNDYLQIRKIHLSK